MALTTPDLTRQVLQVVYVLARQNTPPGGPATGDRYIVGTVPTGAWVGHGNAFAKWDGAAWIFSDPAVTDFWGAYSILDAAYWGYSGAGWIQLTVTPQALAANLTAFAALVGAADQLPYFTGVAALALTTLTSFMRTLLDDPAAVNARATLGLVIGTDVQAFNANLQAIAGLVSAADQLPYFTGAGTAALTTLTSFMRTLLDDVAAVNARSTLGLVIGTDVQAFNANLAAFAGLTGAADQLPYFTGAAALALTTLTSAARTVLDDTTVAAMLATLGGLALAGGQLTGHVGQTPTAFAFSATLSIDVSTNNTFQQNNTSTASFTLTLTNGIDGDQGSIYLRQDGTGGRKITAVTVSGRTVQMQGGLSTLNDAAWILPNAVGCLTYQYCTVNGVALCILGMNGTQTLVLT